MSLFEKTRTKIGAFLLRSGLKKKKRQTAVCGLRQAGSIGIVFNAGSRENFEELRRLLRSLPANIEKRSVIGYLPDRKMEHSYISDKNWYFLDAGELDFFCRPNTPEVLDFCQQKWDLLLVVDNSDLFPIEWIAASSTAGFKAGQQGAYAQHLDFMIELHSGGVKELIDSLLHYLGALNQSNDEVLEPKL
ncbi:MAG TPA: hypothetical protein GXZ39_11250 [Bacteroidales bacterium]|nr:hypothetical protein [Bacteroidales bacterium]